MRRKRKYEIRKTILRCIYYNKFKLKNKFYIQVGLRVFNVRINVIIENKWD